MAQIGSLVGAALILWAYAGQQFGRMTTQSRVYLSLNFLGSAMLATVAATQELWGFVILNGVWAIVSAGGMARSLR